MSCSGCGSKTKSRFGVCYDNPKHENRFYYYNIKHSPQCGDTFKVSGSSFRVVAIAWELCDGELIRTSVLEKVSNADKLKLFTDAGFEAGAKSDGKPEDEISVFSQRRGV